MESRQRTATASPLQMFDFYLSIIDNIVNTQNFAFQTKFNNLVYADAQLSSDEKFCLLGEMQKRWQKHMVAVAPISSQLSPQSVKSLL